MSVAAQRSAAASEPVSGSDSATAYRPVPVSAAAATAARCARLPHW